MKNQNDFPPEVMNLFDKYVHGDIDRRGFIDGAGRFAISACVASSYLSALIPNFAAAQKVAPDDKRLKTNWVVIPSPKGSGNIKAYEARPSGFDFGKKRPVVLIIHENRGLNPHIMDIARRIALEGFIAIAPDALTSLGGYPGNEDDARAKFATLDQVKIKQDFVAASFYAKNHNKSNGKLGAVGFCYGGGMVNYLATIIDYLRVGVPFYGAPAPIDGVAHIKAKFMLHFAFDDERFNAMWPQYETALKANKKNYQAFFYEKTVHGFNNDTTPRYNEEMAMLAWSRTIKFLRENL